MQMMSSWVGAGNEAKPDGMWRSKVNRCSVETCMVLGKDCYGFESCFQGDVSGQFYQVHQLILNVQA